MRYPLRKFVIALVFLGIAVALFRAALSEVFGPEDSGTTMIAGIASLLGLLVAGYWVVASGLAAWGTVRIANTVIARWDVPAATWERYCAVKLADARVSLPGLSGLMFEPRRKATTDPVEVVCGKRGVLIDGHFFSVAPGRGAGMEQAGMVHTQPPCVALVIATRTGAPRTMRTVRRLLLLPIPGGAERETNKAIVHYAAAVDSVRGFGDIAQAHPAVAKTLFWIVFLVSALVGATGFWLETTGYPGDLPAVLGLGGIAVALGTLVLGFAFRTRR